MKFCVVNKMRSEHAHNFNWCYVNRQFFAKNYRHFSNSFRTQIITTAIFYSKFRIIAKTFSAS